MKIKYENREKKDTTKNINDIPVGTAFSGQVYDVKGVFLRVCDNVVCLEHPYFTWRVQANLSLVVQDYKELNAEVVIS